MGRATRYRLVEGRPVGTQNTSFASSRLNSVGRSGDTTLTAVPPARDSTHTAVRGVIPPVYSRRARSSILCRILDKTGRHRDGCSVGRFLPPAPHRRSESRRAGVPDTPLSCLEPRIRRHDSQKCFLFHESVVGFDNIEVRGTVSVRRAYFGSPFPPLPPTKDGPSFSHTEWTARLVGSECSHRFVICGLSRVALTRKLPELTSRQPF